MNFQDKGIIIARRPLKENSFIITLFTENHGLYSAVIRGLSKKSSSIYQEGNIVDFLWQARLDEHLGSAKCELIKSYSGILITNKTKLYAFNSIISLIKGSFHEREKHNKFFPIFQRYLDNLTKDNLSQDFILTEYIKLELIILQECGYGVNLRECVVTGSQEELCYVSPKSASAVCFSAGAPYKDKLLPLPQFLISKQLEISYNDKKDAFKLTTYFLNRYLLNNQPQLYARNKFIEHILVTN